MLPSLPDIGEIHRRLQAIFPEGTPQRGYCTREMAARTVFAMLYVGATEGAGRWIGPKHVYRMGDGQAARQGDADRLAYTVAVEKPGFVAPADRWFQDNTREPIRDETLRDGLVRIGAVVTRPGLATTSSKGRYALQAGFASLFDPGLADEPLAVAIGAWQDRSLSAGALARVRLQQRSLVAAQSRVLVTLPNGESRQMEAGPSSIITKAVVEVFAPRFLGDPAVLWISESGNKVIQRDDELAQSLRLAIRTDKLLPDTILVDLAPAEPLLTFVEAVATDGPITEARRSALLELVTSAGFKHSQVAFVTAFQDRNAGAFKKAMPNLAWGSFAWCVSEPEHLIALDGKRSGGARLLSEFGGTG
ncbi:BsuBI/PstI family type II restriction endonuclease [Chelatococcus reniformis]|uniref:Restriction endonuclease n=1 Tax=Chelatococcus reniformis TaxID=1494448 RepID=A0A916XB75_9HYPH|nr:BsuBI/PstI family type II restriction endonuclease [Chelatococcus reniformis]GGC58974.1 restriction endonuclease [Chelatococcus reniformis]